MSATQAIPGMPQPVQGARALWSALDASANPLSMLIMLAALIRTLGASDYGVLAIALAFSGIAMAVNPAIATTTTRFVAEAVGRRGSSLRPVASVVTTALSAVLVMDLVLVGCTAIWRDRISKWAFGDSIDFAGRDMVLILAMTAVAIQQIDAVIGAAIRGLERFQCQALVELSMRTVLTGCVVIVSWLTGSITAILIAQSSIFAVFLLLRIVALRGLMPERRLFARSSRKEVLGLLRYGGWMWLTAMAGVAYTSADRIVVGRVLGAASAGEYSVFVQLTQLIHFVPSNLFSFSLPAFSRLNAAGSAGLALERAYWRYFRAICTIALGLTLALLVAWPLVMRLFAAGSLPAGMPTATVTLLALNFLLLAANVVPYYLLLALGKSKPVSLTISTWMGVSLLLMTFLIPRFGLAGAAAARLAYGFGALSLVFASRRELASAKQLYGDRS